MLKQRMASGLGEKVAVTGAAILAVTSFLPYWASIRWETTDTFVLLGGPTRFDIWEAYPTVVLLGIALSFIVLALGMALLLTGKPSLSPALLYVAGGGLITVLLLYGIWEGPRGLFESPILGGGASGAFYYDRGPLLYVGLAAAVTIVIGGMLARREEHRMEAGESS